MLYLAQISYRTAEYMQDGHKDHNVTRLVEADTAEEAEDKVVKLYESKSDNYGTYYSGIGVDLSEVIK